MAETESQRNFEQTIEAMIAEQGEAWLQVSDFDNRSELHNAVVITNSPQRCWRLTCIEGKWTVRQDKLNDTELGEFFAAFGSHWNVLINVIVTTSSGNFPIRAFIKNGRKRSGFSVSIDTSKAVVING